MADLATIAALELDANTSLFEGINALRNMAGLPPEFDESDRVRLLPRFHDRYTGMRFKERIARSIQECIMGFQKSGKPLATQPESPQPAQADDGDSPSKHLKRGR